MTDRKQWGEDQPEPNWLNKIVNWIRKWWWTSGG